MIAWNGSKHLLIWWFFFFNHNVSSPTSVETLKVCFSACVRRNEVTKPASVKFYFHSSIFMITRSLLVWYEWNGHRWSLVIYFTTFSQDSEFQIKALLIFLLLYEWKVLVSWEKNYLKCDTNVALKLPWRYNRGQCHPFSYLRRISPSNGFSHGSSRNSCSTFSAVSIFDILIIKTFCNLKQKRNLQRRLI